MNDFATNTNFMINLYGGQITYKKQIITGYRDPDRGIDPIFTSTDTTINSVIKAYSKKKNTESIEEGDLNVIIAGDVNFVPSTKDRLVIAGLSYQIVSISLYQIGGITIRYELQARILV
jgi:hypothetical protein